jgi:membrane associated rhomboid family serine protease
LTAPSNTGVRRGIRTLLQTVAGGGLTALVTVIAGGLPVATSGALVAIFGALVALAQNWLESAGKVPILLPTRTTVASAFDGLAQATVGAAIESGGKVVGQVTDLAGDVVGQVTGQVDPPARGTE